MWTRIGAAITLFGGLVSVMVQLIILQATPAIGVAFGDCFVGAIGRHILSLFLCCSSLEAHRALAQVYSLHLT